MQHRVLEKQTAGRDPFAPVVAVAAEAELVRVAASDDNDVAADSAAAVAVVAGRNQEG